jgi:hypothetical protein
MLDVTHGNVSGWLAGDRKDSIDSTASVSIRIDDRCRIYLERPRRTGAVDGGDRRLSI